MTNEIKNLSPKKRESLGRAINKVKGKYLGKQLGSQIVQFGRSEKIETEIVQEKSVKNCAATAAKQQNGGV